MMGILGVFFYSADIKFINVEGFITLANNPKVRSNTRSSRSLKASKS